jgi:hypothetical protein
METDAKMVRSLTEAQCVKSVQTADGASPQPGNLINLHSERLILLRVPHTVDMKLRQVDGDAQVV